MSFLLLFLLLFFFFVFFLFRCSVNTIFLIVADTTYQETMNLWNVMTKIENISGLPHSPVFETLPSQRKIMFSFV